MFMGLRVFSTHYHLNMPLAQVNTNLCFIDTLKSLNKMKMSFLAKYFQTVLANINIEIKFKKKQPDS